MFYVNFEGHITRPYGIILKNWPLKEFKNPSSIHARADLSILWNAFETGTTHFYKMKDAEYREWEAKEAESRALRGRRAEEQMPSELIDAAIPLPQHPPPTTTLPTAPTFPAAPIPPTPISANPPDPNTSNFVTSTVVTNVNGEAVFMGGRPRKKRSDAGVPRKKRVSKDTQAVNRGETPN